MPLDYRQIDPLSQVRLSVFPMNDRVLGSKPDLGDGSQNYIRLADQPFTTGLSKQNRSLVGCFSNQINLDEGGE